MIVLVLLLQASSYYSTSRGSGWCVVLLGARSCLGVRTTAYSTRRTTHVLLLAGCTTVSYALLLVHQQHQQQCRVPYCYLCAASPRTRGRSEEAGRRKRGSSGGGQNHAERGARRRPRAARSDEVSPPPQECCKQPRIYYGHHKNKQRRTK